MQARPLYVYIGDDDPRTPRWSAAGQRGELLVDAQPARPCSWHAAHRCFRTSATGRPGCWRCHLWHGRFFEGVTSLPSDSFDQRCWDTRLSDMLHFLYENPDQVVRCPCVSCLGSPGRLQEATFWFLGANVLPCPSMSGCCQLRRSIWRPEEGAYLATLIPVPATGCLEVT
jgi:hypothetical protein